MLQIVVWFGKMYKTTEKCIPIQAHYARTILKVAIFLVKSDTVHKYLCTLKEKKWWKFQNFKCDILNNFQVKHSCQTGHFKLDKNRWKTPKLKCDFLVIFQQCAPTAKWEKIFWEVAKAGFVTSKCIFDTCGFSCFSLK